MRDTNQVVDKSQHAKKEYTAALGSVKPCKLDLFYLEWCIFSSCSPAGLLCGVWLVVWQKEPVLWQQRQPVWQRRTWHLDPVCWELTQTGQTLPSWISALWFPLPWPTLIVIPHYFAKGGGMNHKLLQRNDISCSKTTPPLPLILTDKGNKFHRRLKYKQPSSEEDPGDLAPALWRLLGIPK